MKRSLPSQSSKFNFFHKKTNQTELGLELIITEEVPCAFTTENCAIESTVDLPELRDIGRYVDVRITDDKCKYDLLKNPWLPSSNYNCPIVSKRKLKFQFSWLTRFSWLSNSKQLEGALCKVCVLFSNECTGKVGALVTDETCDISRIEQMSLCVRYIEDCSIREDFLTFIPIYDAPGKGLARTIMIEIDKLGLKKENLVGQGYDGASSMSTIFNGVQKNICDITPHALYVHCAAHSLNLAINKSYYFKSKLIERFIKHNYIISGLQNLIPSFLMELKPSSDEFKKCIDFYKSFLPTYETFESELKVWVEKWKSVPDNELSKSTIDTLGVMSKDFYPNIWCLISILATLLVSISSAERSFSTLRRLKTYLRNSCSEDRLTGLALLSVHRGIQIDIEEIINTFSKTPRKVDFIL
ncbi:hypothetical protein QTP88_000342 [Uroleucon formosanum]